MIPKFRAWDKNKKWMVYDVQDTYDGLWSERNSDEVNDYYSYASTFQSFTDEEDFNFMQSTGLKDQNGVEIYEGDIVQMQWTIYDEPELFYIRTIEGRAPRVDNRIKGKELWLVHQDCKVVGNIYQNRELLEVAE